MSIFSNETKNQHYVSQVEQRMNAINKNASNKNMRIYKFTRNEQGQFGTGESSKIENNQCDNDLYTLAIKDNNRKNLENLMNRLESDYSNAVSKVETSCRSHKDDKGMLSVDIDDIKKILAIKMLTRFRNPYLIKETLRLISFTNELILDDDRHFEALVALHKAKNNIDYLSNKYKVTKSEYISWLNTLVGLLLPVKDDGLFLGMIDEFFEAPEFGKIACIYYYDTDCVLLPDCGTLEMECDNSITFGFNVTSKIFILLFMPVCKDSNFFKIKKRTQSELDDLFYKMKEINPNVTNKSLQDYLNFEADYRSQTKIIHKGNDAKMLDTFNFGVQRSSKQYYFSSSSIS